MAAVFSGRPLLERERELDVLRGMLGDARKGRGGLAFVEAPAGRGKTALLRALRREATEWGFAQLIERGGIDVLQPDLTRCGGFTVARKIVHMADRANRLVIQP